MDKFELKEKLIEIHDTLESLLSGLMKTGATDGETAEIRSRVISNGIITCTKLEEEIYNIY